VCFGTEEYSINLVGEIEITTLPNVKQEMWYDGLAFHFTGPDDPNYCVLKFTTKRYKIFIFGQSLIFQKYEPCHTKNKADSYGASKYRNIYLAMCREN